MSKVIVVGGGPAGMFAAIAAAERGHEVVLLEKMKSLGKSSTSPAKGGATSRMQGIWTPCLPM